MYLPQIYLQCRQGPTLGSFFPERRVISVRKVRAFQAGYLIEGMISYFQQYTFWGSPSHSEPQKEAEIHEYSNLFAQWLRENTPIRKNLTSGNAHYDKIPWNRKLDVTASNIGEELGRRCFHVGGRRKELSCWGECWGVRRREKKSFPGLFCCCCYFGFCFFVCFKSLLMHTTTWHQYPALPRTNEMTTGPIMVLDGNKRNSLLVCCWFSLCTPVYPSPPKFQFNPENVSNQWWAPVWGLLESHSL